jgi:hypothetical protein
VAVELAAAVEFKKPLIMRIVSATAEQERCTISTLGSENMLFNFHHVVNVENSDAAVLADKIRELATVRQQAGGIAGVTKEARAALYAGYTALLNRISEVDMYACGERSPLRSVQDHEVALKALKEAARQGYLDAVVEITAWLPLAALRSTNMPLVKASSNNKVKAIKALLRAGVDVNLEGGDLGTPLCEAARNGCLEAMDMLLRAGANIDKRANGWAPLFCAAKAGKEAAVVKLLSAGADPSLRAGRSLEGTPLYIAMFEGHAAVVLALVRLSPSCVACTRDISRLCCCSTFCCTACGAPFKRLI